LDYGQRGKYLLNLVFRERREVFLCKTETYVHPVPAGLPRIARVFVCWSGGRIVDGATGPARARELTQRRIMVRLVGTQFALASS
jgi:hypothetical protein